MLLKKISNIYKKKMLGITTVDVLKHNIFVWTDCRSKGKELTPYLH